MKKNRLNRFLPHVLFWIIYLIFNTFMDGHPKGNYTAHFQLFICYMPIVMMATYFTLYFLIPRFLLKRRFLLFAIWFICSALFFSLLQRINVMYYVAPKYDPEYLNRTTFSTFSILYQVAMIYTIVTIASAIKLLKYWYKTEYLKQQIEKEKLHSELTYLKAQIHPHFLFNTLNNLYALVLMNDPRTAEVVLKLSGLLDYILYKCNTPFINLEKEIALLDNYITLEKLRYGKHLDIKFEKNGNFQGLQIVPLLLLPLVENAFKHGTSENPLNPWLHIQLDITTEQIIFIVKNGKYEKKPIPEKNPGIGLRNVRRRLELVYPDAHTLTISDQNYSYEVVLTIKN
ncbi:sensor histidine kinase [bacterium]|nr:sensor histidine kinase [bacterium]